MTQTGIRDRLAHPGSIDIRSQKARIIIISLLKLSLCHWIKTLRLVERFKRKKNFAYEE